MPKNSKKKKDKSADFAKAKLKLGKGKQLAKNAVDTSFKARSIAIPTQSISLEKDASKPTTRRNLTLDDLLVHLKHYNPSTRKDAIMGLWELLEAHPQLMATSLSSIIQACARNVGDEDTEVRKALLDFLSWLLRLVPLNQVHPHSALLALFITSAQTNIFPAIRIDAVRFLDLLLEINSEIVTNDWNEVDSTGSRALDGYLGLLSVSASFGTAHKDDTPVASTSSVTLSHNSKLVVLSSLSTFLRTAISNSSSRQEYTIPMWYMASSFATYAEYLAFCSLIQPQSDERDIRWSKDIQAANFEDFAGNFLCELAVAPDSGFALEELKDVGQAIAALKSDSAGASASHSKSLRIARLARALQPVLVSTWLDVAPTIFGINASGVRMESQLALSVAQIAGCLYGAAFRELGLPTDVRMTALTDLTSLLGYMSAYLPYISETEEAQSEKLLSDLNVAYCELTSLAVMESQHRARGTSVKTLGLKQSKALSTQIGRVGDYVVRVLDGELGLRPLGYSLTASSYTTLMPTIWSLLKYQCMYASNDKRICISILNHAIRTSSRSSVKGVATQFVGMLVLFNSQPQQSLEFHLGFTPNECELVREWHLQLPRVLWEVGATNPSLTETILRLLLRIEQRHSALFDVNTLASFRSRLVPYFVTTHPQKGDILGPFTKLQQYPLHRLTLDVIFVLLQDSSSLDDELKVAVDKSVRGTRNDPYWSSLLQSAPRWNARKR